MHGIVRIYEFDQKDAEEIANFARKDFGDILKAHDGFVSFNWIDSGDGEGVSMAIWETKEEAEASTFLAGGFVHDHLKTQLPKPPRVIEGGI